MLGWLIFRGELLVSGGKFTETASCYVTSKACCCFFFGGEGGLSLLSQDFKGGKEISGKSKNGVKKSGDNQLVEKYVVEETYYFPDLDTLQLMIYPKCLTSTGSGGKSSHCGDSSSFWASIIGVKLYHE